MQISSVGPKAEAEDLRPTNTATVAIPTAEGLIGSFLSFFQNWGWNVFFITQVPP